MTARNGTSPIKITRPLPRWADKLLKRLGQCHKPGVYSFDLLIEEDGTRFIVPKGDYQKEWLGDE